MPELPEVETIRRDLENQLLNKKITDIDIMHKKTVRNSPAFFTRNLKGRHIRAVQRVGKLVIFEISNNSYLLVHLKMTGQLIYKKGSTVVAGGHSDEDIDFNLPNRHTRVHITFKDGSSLFFNDMRIFGYMKIVNEKDKEIERGKFGIEPLTDNFVFNGFERIFKNRKTNLKAILLNQKLIAGLGNIYVDEVCFDCGVRPNRLVNTLSVTEIKSLFKSIEKILRKAIENRGTTFNNYVDASGNKGNFVKYLRVYGRGGEDCTRCKNVLTKIKLAGRGTVFCEMCQK